MELVRFIGAFGEYPGAKTRKYQRVVVELPEEVFAVVDTSNGSVKCITDGTWAPGIKYGLCPGEFEINKISQKKAREIVEKLEELAGEDDAIEAREKIGDEYRDIEAKIMNEAKWGYREWQRMNKYK